MKCNNKSGCVGHATWPVWGCSGLVECGSVPLQCEPVSPGSHLATLGHCLVTTTSRSGVARLMCLEGCECMEWVGIGMHASPESQ